MTDWHSLITNYELVPSVREQRLVKKSRYYELRIILMLLTQTGGAFNFLENEPDIYSLDDGEHI
jgi:hypothetical protein